MCFSYRIWQIDRKSIGKNIFLNLFVYVELENWLLIKIVQNYDNIYQDLRKWVGRVGHLLTQIYNTYVCLSVCPRVGKTESLGLWSKVIVYCFKLSSRQNDRPMGQSFLQKESLLQYTMNLLKGPKDPSVHIFWKKIFFPPHTKRARKWLPGIHICEYLEKNKQGY